VIDPPSEGCRGAGGGYWGWAHCCIGGVLGIGCANRVPHQEQKEAPGATPPLQEGQLYN
jgi:hypothetical protein